MNRSPARLLALILGVALLSPAAPAFADHLVLEADTPTPAESGDAVEIEVVLRHVETQQRIPGGTVVVSREATIVGVTGEVELASATTNEDGIATLRWRQGAETDHIVLIAYATSGDIELESTPISVLVVGPKDQVFRSTSGIRIPGFGAWVLIGLIISVWGIIQFALVGPVLVASRFDDSEEDHGRARAFDK